MFALHIHLLFQLISNSLNHCANFLFHTISIRILHVFFIHKFDYYSFLLDPIIYYHLHDFFENNQFLYLVFRKEEEVYHRKVHLDLLETLRMIDQPVQSSLEAYPLDLLSI